MTNEEYNVFMCAVDENINRIERIARVNQRRIALIVSMDIYHLMIAHAQNPIYTGDTYGEYHGVSIAVVSQEHHMTEFAKPAIIGMVYDPMMLEGDNIVVGDDNSLYRLESREPLQFSDMGVTVQFGPTTFNGEQAIEAEQQVATPVTATVPTVADVANTTTMTITADGDGAYWVTDAMTGNRVQIGDLIRPTVDVATANVYAEPYWARAPYEPYADYNRGMFTGTLAGTMNVDALREAIGVAGYEYTYRPEDRVVMRKRPKKEEELKPGDTKALDEFLDSFIRHGA